MADENLAESAVDDQLLAEKILSDAEAHALGLPSHLELNFILLVALESEFSRMSEDDVRWKKYNLEIYYEGIKRELVARKRGAADFARAFLSLSIALDPFSDPSPIRSALDMYVGMGESYGTGVRGISKARKIVGDLIKLLDARRRCEAS